MAIETEELGLRISVPGSAARRETLDRQGTHLLGRDEDCQVRIEARGVSRHHAKIAFKPQHGWTIEDLDSTNGTYVNGEEIDETNLAAGDEIHLGEAVIGVRIAGAESIPMPRRVPTSPVMLDASEPPSPRDTSVTLTTGLPTESATINTLPASEPLKLTEIRLKMLYDVGKRVAAQLDQKELFSELADVLFEVIRIERVVVGLRERGTDRLTYPMIRTRSMAPERDVAISTTIVDAALRDARNVLVRDTGQSAEFQAAVSIVELHILSAMCVPLITAEEPIGFIYVDNRSAADQFSRNDLDFLAAIGQQTAVALENARLHESEKIKQRMEADLDAARGIQESLLPETLPDVPGCKLAAYQAACLEVGGDVYWAKDLGDGNIALLIADVAGKGMPASLLMASLQAATAVLMSTETPLDKIVNRINAYISNNIPSDRFITAFFGILNVPDRRLCYINAGHNCPLWIADGRVNIFGISGNIPLGVMSDYEYRPETLVFGPGRSTFLAYSDGITEAMNPSLNEYEESRLVTCLTPLKEPPSGAGVSPDELILKVLEDVSRFVAGHPQTDDMTLLTFTLTK